MHAEPVDIQVSVWAAWGTRIRLRKGKAASGGSAPTQPGCSWHTGAAVATPAQLCSVMQAGTEPPLPALSSPQRSLGANSLNRAPMQVSAKAKQQISCPVPYPQAFPLVDPVQPHCWRHFAEMLCAIQISTAWHVFGRGVGRERLRRETVGGGGNGKNKATLGGFRGINITRGPGSAGQGVRCGGSLMGHWFVAVHLACLSCPSSLQLSGICWDDVALIRRMPRWQSNKDTWVEPCAAALPWSIAPLWQLHVFSHFLVTQEWKCGLPHAL